VSNSSASTAPPRTRKPRGQGHERRGEILAAAKALFVAEGYPGFTTRKLAERVGLSQTGLYVYFRSREEIFDALCRQSFARLAEAFREAEQAPGEGFERLRALGHAYIDFGLANPDEYRLTFMDGPGLLKMPDHDPMAGLEPPLDNQGIANQVFGMIHDVLRRLARDGALRPVDLIPATQTTWLSLHGLVSLIIARPRFRKSSQAELIEAMLESLVHSLRGDRA
jgi:AcrR family transcriptional regulator